MIGKGSILYDVTAGVTIAQVSAIGRLDLERTENRDHDATDRGNAGRNRVSA